MRRLAFSLAAALALSACAPAFDLPDPAGYRQCTESGQTCWGSAAPAEDRPILTLQHLDGRHTWGSTLPPDFTRGDEAAVAVLDEVEW